MKKSVLFPLSVCCVGLLFATLSPAQSAAPAIVGTVRLTPKLQHLIQTRPISATAALYVIARPEGMQGGPPAAVKRFTAPFRFPIHFRLTQADEMIPMGALTGQFTLIARVAQSGSAMPASPGDLQTRKGVTASPGGKAVALVLDTVRK